MTDEQKIGDFTFRPPIKDELVEDEMFLDAGKYFIHIERMGDDSIWVGISENGSDKMLHLDFVVGDEKVKDEDGDAIYPIKLYVRGAEIFDTTNKNKLGE